MDLQIFTDDAMEIVKLGELGPEEMVEYQRVHSDDVAGTARAIIGSYVGELIDAAAVAGVTLDLTYDTVGSIAPALGMLYRKQHQTGFIDIRNKMVTCRTLAAYLTLLIVNNFDNVSIGGKVYANKKKQIRPEMWADRIVLTIDHKKNSDLLPYVWQGANTEQAAIVGADGKPLNENKCVIVVAPVAAEYQKLTGDDLTESGLADITLEYEEEKKLVL